MNKKIAILLPYKEIYSENLAGAASIWVKDYIKYSKLSSDTLILCVFHFGLTKKFHRYKIKFTFFFLDFGLFNKFFLSN